MSARRQSFVCATSLKRLSSPHNQLPYLIGTRRSLASVNVPSSEPSTATSAVKPTVLQSVGRATATGSYFVIVSAGCALLGVVVWALGSNLFYETRYFGDAVTLLKNDPEIKKLLGHDINAYGARSPHRGRRGGGVQSQRTEQGDVFMIFHIEGSTGLAGTCRLDVKEDASGNSEIRQLYCDVPGYNRIWIKRETKMQKSKKLFSW